MELITDLFSILQLLACYWREGEGAYKEAIIISYHIILYYNKFIDKLVANFDH
jgi:hypothetical protein